MKRTIPLQNLGGLRAKVEKLNRRAKRLGTKPIELTVLSQSEEARTDPETGIKYNQPTAEVELTGESPVINGWRLIAKLEPAPNGEILAKSVPGEECPDEFRQASLLRCDHCHSRRHRKAIFVVGHENGEFKAVGRNCLGDFLGHQSPEQLLNAATIVWEAESAISEDGFGGFGYSVSEFPIELFVGTTNLFVRRIGWWPRSAGFPATADNVVDFLLPAKSETDKHDKKKFIEENDLHVTETDEQFAEKALAWARELPVEGVGNYLANLGSAARCEIVDRSTEGIVASLIVAYQRHVEKTEVAARKREQEPESNFVGEIKKRQQFTLTVTGHKFFEGSYGLTTLISFVDNNGNRIKWFASGDKEPDWVFGETYQAKGTVKKHDVFAGRKETQLTRVSKIS